MRRWRSLPGKVAAALGAAGHGVAVFATDGPETAGRLAAERVEAGTDLILALGGDGTLNEALPGVVGTGVPVALLPGGTANVLAHELGIGSSAMKAVPRLAEWVPRRIPAGVLQCATGPERYFLLMAGVGLDAHIVYQLSLPLKANLGEFAYWVTSGKQFFRRLDEFQVEANGQTFTCTFALASRVRNYAGYLEIARRVSLVEPELELVLFEGRSTLRYYLKYLAAAVSGRTSNVKGLSFLRTGEAVFKALETTPVHVQVDGEYAGRLPATVRVTAGAVTLLMPPAYLESRS